MDGHETPVTVAHGRVYPTTEQTVLHGAKLPAGMARVEVNKVLDEYFDLAVDISPESDTLGPCKNTFVKWRKELIIVLPSTTQPSRSLVTTPPVPSPLDLSQPLTFAEENHEHTDVEGALEDRKSTRLNSSHAQ